MIVRKIREEEYSRTQELFALAFEIPLDRRTLSAQELDRIRRCPRTREEKYWLERWAAFTDNGEMMSFLIGFPATVRFDGREAVCTCIGGVSSLPQFRGRGAIASCFRRHLEDSYRAGHVFSYLYPFSTRFYRQFGYTLCTERVDWTLDADLLPAVDGDPGTCVLSEDFSHYAEIQAVYNRYLARYNFSFVREDCDWNRVIDRDPASARRYTYLWKNGAGVPKGVFTYRKIYEEGLERATMLCDAFYFADAEGLQGLLGQLRAYRGHFQKIQLTLPKDVALERFLPEVSRGCARTLRFAGMGRVIHAEKALRMAAYRGSGRVSLKLRDSYVSENNRVYTVDFTDGKCTRIQPGEAWDLELDIETFSRWLLGACSDGEVPASLNAIFYPKKLFICDGF